MTATARSSRRRSPKPAASRCRSAPSRTTRPRSSRRCARALDDCDMVVLSGGTSKGAGDLSHRIVSKLGAPGILVHGVALKPGKPLCLAVADGQADRRAAGLSDLGDLHLPCLRRAGDPRPRRPAAGSRARPSRRACRCASRPSSAARNSCWWRWSKATTAPIAFPTAKGSGAVTSFSQADGFLEIDALAGALDAGTHARVTLIGQAASAPDLVVMGSHDVALDVVVGALAERGLTARTIAVGSQGGVDGGAARRMRPRAGASGRSRDRHLQQASARARAFAGQGLAAHAGRAVPAGRRALRGQDRAGGGRRPRSPIRPA